MNEKLKPCPFCGEIVKMRNGGIPAKSYIQCLNANCLMKFYYPKTVDSLIIEAWNTRSESEVKDLENKITVLEKIKKDMATEIIKLQNTIRRVNESLEEVTGKF